MEANIYKIAKEKGYRIDINGNAFSRKQQLKVRKKSTDCPYYCFTIKVGEMSRPIMVHRLQAYQKFGDALFDEGVVARHLNGDSLDNSWGNIAIGTQHDNMMDIPAHIRLANAIRASSFAKKYDHDAVLEFYMRSKSYNKTMEAFNITSKGTLHFIIKNSKDTLS